MLRIIFLIILYYSIEIIEYIIKHLNKYFKLIIYLCQKNIFKNN